MIPNNEQPTKSWMRIIGPNFILVLVLVGYVLYRYHDQLPLRTLFSTSNSTKGNGKQWVHEDIPHPPDYLIYNPKIVLEYKERLGLTEVQLVNIKKIVQDWEKDSKEINEKLVFETQNVQGLVSEKSSIHNVSTLQTQSKDYSDLSQQLSEIRHQYWDKIGKVLTTEQVKQLEQIDFLKKGDTKS